jgi:hypothetical protein
MIAMGLVWDLVLRVPCQLLADDVELGPRQRLAGLSKHCEIDHAESEDLHVRTVGAEEQVVQLTELHFARILVQARKDLRQESGHNVAFHPVGKVMRHYQTFLQRDDCAGNLRKSHELLDDLARLPVEFLRLPRISPTVRVPLCASAGALIGAGEGS